MPAEELYELGHQLMHDSGRQDKALKQAAMFRDGLMIALLSSRPVRLKNLASIEIGRHLDRRDERFWLNFPPREVKNRRALEFPLPLELTDRLETYLSEVRPVLLEASGRWNGDPGLALWISEHGSRMLAGQIRHRIAERTRVRFGQRITPHLFRDIAATSVATNDPEHVGMIISILGHSTIKTSERYYNQASSLAAARRLQDVVKGLQNKSSVAEATS